MTYLELNSVEQTGELCRRESGAGHEWDCAGGIRCDGGEHHGG